MARHLTLIALCLALAGCVATAPLGEPLTSAAGTQGYRFRVAAPERRADDLLFVMSFSGGGNRAAALAYGVLEQLAADRVAHDGRSKRLLDEVDVISSVSGGSVVAVYFALHGDRLFERFRVEYLDRDLERELWHAMLFSPRNWLKLSSRNYARGDLFADHLDRLLFGGSTFADLLQPGERPFVIVNATDLSASGRFEFTQDWFDVVCVDLATYPLARAVAASSAYPLMLTPLTLRNNAGHCGYRPPAPIIQSNPGTLSRETGLTLRLNAYQDTSVIRYLHLADGAMADNLGIRSTIDALLGARDFIEAQSRLGLAGIRRVVVVTVDATGKTGGKLARRRRPPGIISMARLAGAAMIDEAANENRALLREQLARLTESVRATDHAPPEMYWVDVELGALADDERRERLRAIPTSMSVAPARVSELICSARELLGQSADYRRLLRDLAGGEPSPAACSR